MNVFKSDTQIDVPLNQKVTTLKLLLLFFYKDSFGIT